jgi:hypothetical protein
MLIYYSAAVASSFNFFLKLMQKIACITGCSFYPGAGTSGMRTPFFSARATLNHQAGIKGQ